MANLEQAVGIVGLGAVTGYGWGRDALWQGLMSGRSAGTPIEWDDLSGFAAMVPDGGDEKDSVTLFGRAMYASAREAVADAEARGWRAGPRVGLILCSSLGEVQGWRDLYFRDGGKVRRRDFLQLLPSTAPSMFMAEYGFHGPSMNVGAACASGALGVILARQWVRSGFASDVIVIGTDLSVTYETAWHFTALNLVIRGGPPEETCRPFQEGSQGFLAGEASTALVVTADPEAHAYAHVLGAGYTHDAFHPIAIKPDGVQVLAAWRDALSEADVPAQDVAYVNAHGSGTALGDWVEAVVADQLFAETTRIYTTKMLVGHSLGATGAVETAVAAMTYEIGQIPAARLVAQSHPRVLDGVTPRVPGPTLKSSLGMGGYNAALVLDRLGDRG